MTFRTKLHYLVESPDEENNDNSSFDWYDITMMIAIVTSLVPLAFKQDSLAFHIIDKVTVCVFILDYLLRWMISDLKMKKGAKSFFIYPLTPMAVLDLLTILPSISLVSGSFKLFKLVRLLRTFRAFRVFKAIRYSGCPSRQRLCPFFRNSGGTVIAAAAGKRCRGADGEQRGHYQKQGFFHNSYSLYCGRNAVSVPAEKL